MSSASAIPSRNNRLQARRRRADPMRSLMLQRSELITSLSANPTSPVLREKMTQLEKDVYALSEQQKRTGVLGEGWSIHYQYFHPEGTTPTAAVATTSVGVATKSGATASSTVGKTSTPVSLSSTTNTAATGFAPVKRVSTTTTSGNVSFFGGKSGKPSST